MLLIYMEDRRFRRVRKAFTPYSLVGLWRGLGFGRFLVGNQIFYLNDLYRWSPTRRLIVDPLWSITTDHEIGGRETRPWIRDREGSDKSGIKMDCEFAMPPGRW